MKENQRPGTVVLGALVVFAAACGGGGGGSAPAPLESTLGPLGANAQLYYDNGGGIADSTRLVIRDEAGLTEVWERATSEQMTPPPVPTIDFERQMVVVVAAGEMTPEDRIQIDSVGVRRQRDDTGDMEEHFVAIVRTTEACRRFDLPAHPVQIVQVRRFDGPVSFVERKVKEECPAQPETGGPMDQIPVER